MISIKWLQIGARTNKSNKFLKTSWTAIFGIIDEIESVSDTFQKIGLFAFVCSAALIFYGVCVLSALLFLTTRLNPFKYYLHFAEPALLAFASTSGAVCMHKSMEICENKLRIDKRICRFTIPFYTALQADGSAIFIVISSVFLAVYSNLELSIVDYVVVMIETFILCTCLPSIPSSSIVTILVVLNSINLNGANLGILFTTEFLLDRLRTTVNLYSHDFCVVITNHLVMNSIQSENEIELDLANSKETVISI